MSVGWLVETIVGAAVTWVTFAGLTWLWAERRLLPWLRRQPHLRALARLLVEDAGDE